MGLNMPARSVVFTALRNCEHKLVFIGAVCDGDVCHGLECACTHSRVHGLA